MEVINYSNMQENFVRIYCIEYRREDKKNEEDVNVVARGIDEALEAFYRYFSTSMRNPMEIPKEVSEKQREAAKRGFRKLTCLEGAVLITSD